MAQNQTPLIGVPFPSFVHVTDTAQHTTLGALLNAIGEVDASPSITGVAATGGAGTARASLSPGTLTGVGSTGGTGVLTVEVDVAITGLATTSAIGSLVPDLDTSLTGLEATAAIGTPTVVTGTLVDLVGVEATASIGSPYVEIDYTLTGLAATTALGTLVVTTPILIPITGLEATAGIGSVYVEIDIPASSEVATAAIGIVAVHTELNVMIFSGVQATTAYTTPFVTLGPNLTYIHLTGLSATAGLGSPYVSVGAYPVGVAATAHIGNPLPLITSQGMLMGELTCISNVELPDNLLVNMRWSDDGGASWSGSLAKDFGATGSYLTSLQWRRVGMARGGRIFEFSWSAPIPTALVGANIHYETSGT